ncbi:MAG: copper chaperone PCu(A)C [Burkholderiaceae bacterium]|nr:copper chaperone PCu(A)C [Burkholderiaceae bacterium]
MAAVMAMSLTAQAQRSAEVEVKSAWARPTVAGQMGTGAFMQLRSKDGARVVGASSEIAGVVEIHEMAMDGSVMRMRPIRVLDLPPGSNVELKPGGHHMMLMDLKRPLATGEKIKVELRLETRDKKLITQPIEIEVRPRAP